VILNFWQNIPSPHQSACLRALAAQGHTVHLVVDQDELPARRAMGWGRPDFGETRLIVAPDSAAITRLLDETAPHGAVNIISGLRSARVAAEALAGCARRGARAGLLCEPPDPRGLSGLLRRGLYAWEALRWRGAVDFVLAMGQTGVDWYRASGYPAATVFHFGYAVETPDAPPLRQNDVPSLVFVGSLIPLKGVDLLLRALAGLTDTAWTLHLVGDGPARAALAELAQRCGLADRVQFHGLRPMPQVMPHIAAADLLVLPSRKDGWGAVVNEALGCGVPVVCSDRCGAADLLRAPERGTVVTGASVAALRRALAARLRQGPVTAAARARLRAWAQCIAGPAMAQYLRGVLSHVYDGAARPTAPWHAASPAPLPVE